MCISQYLFNLLYGWHTCNKVSCNPCPSGTVNSNMPSKFLPLSLVIYTHTHTHKNCIQLPQCWLKPSIHLKLSTLASQLTSQTCYTQGHNATTTGISTNDRKTCSDAHIQAISCNSRAYIDDIPQHIRFYHILYHLQWSHRKYVKFLCTTLIKITHTTTTCSRILPEVLS